MDGRQILEEVWGRAHRPLEPSDSHDGPEIEMLDRRRRSGEAPDWNAAVAHVGEACARRDAGDLSGALATFAAAYACSAPDPSLLLHVVATLLGHGDHAAAEAWALRMIEDGGDTADVRLHLAHALWGGQREPEALAACDDMIARFPLHGGAVLTAATLWLLGGQADKAVDACLALLQAAPGRDVFTVQHHDVLARAIVASGRPSPPASRAALRGAVAEAGTGSDLERSARLLDLHDAALLCWSELFRPSASAEGRRAAELLRDAPRDLVEQLLLRSQRPPRIISLHDHALLREAYPDLTVPDVLEREGFELAEAVSPESIERGDTASTFAFRMTTWSAAERHQVAIVRRGQVDLVSPFGEKVTSASSVALYYAPQLRQNACVVCYFFSHPRPLFAIFATAQFWPIAWYDPAQDVVLRHGRLPAYENYLTHIVWELRFVLLTDADAASRYLSRDEERRGKPVSLLFGMLDYMSTHILNIRGLQSVVDADLAGRVERIVLTAPEPLGPIEDYFDVFASGSIVRPAFGDVVQLNRYLWGMDTLFTCVTGGWTDSRTAARVVKRASALSSAEWKYQVDMFVSRAYPVLFIALRAHSRRWLADASQIARLLVELQKGFPTLGLIFDGHTVQAGGPDEPTRTIMERERAMLGPIIERLPSSIPVLVSQGRSLEESIYAACASHMHLSAQGTSGTKPSLIGGKPGVLIGSRQFTYNIAEYRSPPAFTVVPWREAVDAEQRNAQCDYRLPWEVVLQALRTVGHTLPPNPR